jgi:hypothetical protein
MTELGVMKDGPTSLVRLRTSHWIRIFFFFFWAQRKTDQEVCKDLGPVPRTTCLLFELLFVVTNFSASWMTRFVLMSCFLIFLVCWLSSFARLVFSWWRRTRSLFVFERGMARLLSTARQFDRVDGPRGHAKVARKETEESALWNKAGGWERKWQMKWNKK